MSSDNGRVRWHSVGTEESLQHFASDAATGLTSGTAAERLAAHGPNEVAVEEARSVGRIVLAQLTDFMILVLLAAALIAGLLGEVEDSIAIVVIVVLNAVVGAAQEYRAQRAIAALRRLSALEARVRRDGREQSIPAAELVPGDIVLLNAGAIVPADLRLIESKGLTLDESTLTGESLPVNKTTAPLADESLAIGDRSNLSFKSTSVTRGKGFGVVVATGLSTEIGRIAHLLATGRDYGTPLQRRLAAFGRRLALVVLAICAVVFLLGLLQGREPLIMFLTAVSLAVAAIPEALPAVVTASLALGARKLSRQQCLVRRLPAVETLGSVTFICADKTGTLTENRMRLASVAAGDMEAPSLNELPGAVSRPLGAALALCNELGAAAAAADDPTETALRDAARAAGFEAAALAAEEPEQQRFAFDSERMRMTTVHATGDGFVAYSKGAPEAVLERCTAELTADGGSRPIDRDARLAATQALAKSGHRVLAVALRRLDALPAESAAEAIERELVLVGLVALHDPVRPEVPQAIADCITAGIAPVMITGDHPDTARQIGRELGLPGDGSVLTGRELTALSQEQLADRLEACDIYARVDPEQKIRIVDALQQAGEFVAMTGDGVNDAPALRQASIGVAMGQRGTDVAREAADMVLLDDNFATIVAAIREGRRVYDNIRKFIKYTLTSNAGEILVLLLAPLLGLPIPLVPIQILWINLVTDGLPGLAFSAEPAERDVMRRPPRPPRESVFAHGMWAHIAWVGSMIGGVSLATIFWAGGEDVAYWQTMVFTTLVVAQLAQALAVRSEQDSLLAIGVFSNPFLLGAIVLTLFAQLAVTYLPAMNVVFATVPLTAIDFLVCLALGAAVLPAVELGKWLSRRARR